MTALAHFLVRTTHVFGPLKDRLSADLDSVLVRMDDDSVVQDNVLFHLFSHAFSFHLEVLSVYNNRLSIQYFGLQSKPVKRVYADDCSYVLLKRMISKTSKASCGFASLTASPRGKLRTVDSIATATTAAVELLSMHRCSTDASSSSINTEQTTVADFIAQGNKPEVSPVACVPTDGNSAPYFSGEDSVITPMHPFVLSKGAHSPSKTLGRLKFFNEAKEYGFIVCEDLSEIFVHKADLQKQSIDTRYLAYFKKYYDIVMEFNVQEYQGKSKKHRKAVDVLIYDMQALC